jgi:hypothetical protein
MGLTESIYTEKVVISDHSLKQFAGYDQSVGKISFGELALTID